MKNKIRIALLVVGGLIGGHLVDENMKSKYPIFTIVFPIAAGAMFWRLAVDSSNSDENSEN